MDGGRCMMNDEWWMLNDEWWMVNVEWWMVNDDDDDGDFDDDDDDPAELFQTQGKWWELIVWLPFPVMGGFWHCFTHISPGIPMGIPYSLGMTMMPKCRRCDPHGEYELIHRMLVFWRPPFQNKSEWLSWSAEKSDKSYAKPRSFQCKSWITNIFFEQQGGWCGANHLQETCISSPNWKWPEHHFQSPVSPYLCHFMSISLLMNVFVELGGHSDLLLEDTIPNWRSRELGCCVQYHPEYPNRVL